jgi:hypothetical protein
MIQHDGKDRALMRHNYKIQSKVMSTVMEHGTGAVGLTIGSGKSTTHQQYDLTYRDAATGKEFRMIKR